MAAHKSSSVDKQALVTKLMKRLKKDYGAPAKRESLPVLETLVYAICLEDATTEGADSVYDCIKKSYHDWNEVRVTTISELEPIFAPLVYGPLRAMRIRYLLHYVFDHQYSYDFDALKKKTQELVHKQLAKIKHLTPFVRNYLLQTSLGNHVVPLDGNMCRFAAWLGLLPVGTTPEEGADLLKTVVRKADAPEFIHLFKSASVCPKAAFLHEGDFAKLVAGHEIDLANAEEVLEDILSGKTAKRLAAAGKAAEAKAAVEAAEHKAKSAAKKASAAASASAATKAEPAKKAATKAAAPKKAK
jgi:endonuclease III